MKVRIAQIIKNRPVNIQADAINVIPSSKSIETLRPEYIRPSAINKYLLAFGERVPVDPSKIVFPIIQVVV